MFLSPTFLTEGCSPSTLNIVGTEGPEISASIKPTFAPSSAKATAKLTEVVDFPTPPLPEAIAIMFFTFGRTGAASLTVVTWEVMKMSHSTSLPKSFSSSSRQLFLITSFKGQAGVVKTTLKLTLFPSIFIFWIIPKVTKSFFKSGSCTLERVLRIASADNCIR